VVPALIVKKLPFQPFGSGVPVPNVFVPVRNPAVVLGVVLVVVPVVPGVVTTVGVVRRPKVLTEGLGTGVGTGFAAGAGVAVEAGVAAVAGGLPAPAPTWKLHAVTLRARSKETER
jgi:hypothetical protein